jgi:hypothetical protein
MATDSAAAEPVRLALRKLWSDHVMWTREYIIAATSGPTTEPAPGAVPASDADAAAARLLRNQDDIGNAIVPYYGEAAGKQLTGLLKEHIMIAVELVADASGGNDSKFAKDDARWSENATEIARFLGGANPNWPEKDVADLLALHLELTKGEVVARLQKDWNAAVKAFDDIFTEIMVLADALYEGLVAQFPEKFPRAAARA